MASELSRAKQRAWKAFSEYIRRRDCLDTTGTWDYGICCTCGKQYHFAHLQAGHFIAGRTNSVLFREQGVHGQCRGCNIFGNGKNAEYILYMKDRYGDEVIEQEAKAKTVTTKYTVKDFKEIEKEYKEKLEELCKTQ